MQKTVLVTGGAGFIGSHLCEALVEKGHNVVCIDNFNDYYSPYIKENNIEKLSVNNNFTLYRRDITEFQTLLGVFKENKIDEERFWEIVKKGFAHKRKLLLSNLSMLAEKSKLESAFRTCNIPRKARAERPARRGDVVHHEASPRGIHAVHGGWYETSAGRQERTCQGAL